MDSLIGKRLGQYEIISRLGVGGMATVYRARQASVERDVAIKIIRSDMMNDPMFVERFRREANTIAKLSHPHIVKVFDYGSEGDLAYLAMELLEGGSLARLLRAEGDMPLEKASEMLQQVARALDVAHQQGIIHRDLKPDNILLDSFRNAFLTDFGVAKLLTERKMTSTGTVVGTPAYIAPELWNGSYADNRTDLYALGVIVYEMVTGRTPHNGETPYRMMHMHIYEDALQATSINPMLPPVIDDFLAVALAKNPNQRFRSADHMATVFQAAIHSGRLPAGIVVPPPTGTYEKMPTGTQPVAIAMPTSLFVPEQSTVQQPLYVPSAAAQTVTQTVAQTMVTPQRGGIAVLGVVSILALIMIGLFLTMSGRSTPSAASAEQPTEVAALLTDIPTATATFTETPTATHTETATYTFTPTHTFTPSLTPTEAPNQETLVGLVMATLNAKQTLDIASTIAAYTATMTITPSETPDLLATAQWIVERTATGNAITLALMATNTPIPTATYTSTSTSTVTPTPAWVSVLTRSRANIRIGPSTSYRVLLMVDMSVQLRAFAKIRSKETNDFWFLIEVPNASNVANATEKGWIHESALWTENVAQMMALETFDVVVTVVVPPTAMRTATRVRTFTATPNNNPSSGATPIPPTAANNPSTSANNSPTAVPPTAVPPTAVPPTAVPPTATAIPPTAVPPTHIPFPTCQHQCP